MICRNCNKEISDTSAFCPNCGMLFVVSTPESSPEIRRNNNLPFYSAELFRKMVQEENAQREAEKPAEVQGDAVPAEDSADAQLDKMYARALQLEREERTAKMRMEAEEKARIADEIARKEAEEELKKRMAENERHDREVAEELAKKNVIDEEELDEKDLKEDSAEEKTEDEVSGNVEENETGKIEAPETREAEAPETGEPEDSETGEDNTEAEGDSENAPEKTGVSEAEEGEDEILYPEDDSDDYIFGDEDVEEAEGEEPVASDVEEPAEVVEEVPAEEKSETEEKSDVADIEKTEQTDTSETEETEKTETVVSETEAEESETTDENKTEESPENEAETVVPETAEDKTETEEVTGETAIAEAADKSEAEKAEEPEELTEEIEEPEIDEAQEQTVEVIETEKPSEPEAAENEETAEAEPVEIRESVEAEESVAKNQEAEELVELEAKEEIESASVEQSEDVINITDAAVVAAVWKSVPEMEPESIAAEEGSEKAEESEAENKDKTEILSEQLKQKKYQKKQKRSKSKKKNRKAKREGKDSDQMTEKQGAVSELKTEEKANVPELEKDSVEVAEPEKKTEKPGKVVSESKKAVTGPKISSKAGLTVGAAAAVVVLSLISYNAWNNKPENRAARILKDAESAYSSGDFEKAEGLYSQYMEFGDAETETLLHMADTYVNRNRHDEAVDMIKAALDAHPESEALQKAYNDLNPVISFSEAGGTFDSPISIGLSSSGNCDIYYTLKTADGAEELSKYYLPIILEENGTYEVEAYGQTADGYKGSSVTETYVIDIAPEEEETEESVEETVEETDNGEFSFAKEYESYPDTLVEIQTKDRKDMGDYSVFEAQVYHDHEKDVPVGESRTETIKISNKAWLHYKDYNPNEVRAIDAYVFLKYIGILNARTDENGIVTDFDFYLGRQR